jgi:hypothetical protein
MQLDFEDKKILAKINRELDEYSLNLDKIKYRKKLTGVVRYQVENSCV